MLLLSSTLALNPAPARFQCALTRGIMVDPVLCSDGLCYERDAIETWLEKCRSSPVTGERIGELELIPQDALRDNIHLFLKAVDDHGKESNTSGGACELVGQKKKMVQEGDSYTRACCERAHAGEWGDGFGDGAKVGGIDSLAGTRLQMGGGSVERQRSLRGSPRKVTTPMGDAEGGAPHREGAKPCELAPPASSQVIRVKWFENFQLLFRAVRGDRAKAWLFLWLVLSFW